MSPHGEVIERKVKHHQPAADAEAPVALLLPKEAVAIGAVWNEPRVVPIKTQDGAIRDIQCRRHYKLTKVKDNVATIEVSYQVLSPIDPYIESQLVQRLMKGTAKFDLVRGRIVSQQYGRRRAHPRLRRPRQHDAPPHANERKNDRAHRRSRQPALGAGDASIRFSTSRILADFSFSIAWVGTREFWPAFQILSLSFSCGKRYKMACQTCTCCSFSGSHFIAKKAPRGFARYYLGSAFDRHCSPICSDHASKYLVEALQSPRFA